MKTINKDQMSGIVGDHLGYSDWFEIDQARIDLFADATLDDQFIHVDVEKAAQTPFGGTIAHGYLLLSMFPYLTEPLWVVPEGMAMSINYGLNKVRFVSPVRAGSRVRAGASVADVSEKSPGRFMVTMDLVLELEGSESPAVIAQQLAMFVVE